MKKRFISLSILLSLVFISFTPFSFAEEDVPVSLGQSSDENNQLAIEAGLQSPTSKTNQDIGNPCEGAGSFKFLGIDGLACEIWLYFSNIILKVIAEIFAISAGFFDLVVQKFVLQISTLFKNDNKTNSEYVYLAWSAVRDLANIIAGLIARTAG